MNRREALRSFAMLALAVVAAPVIPVIGERRSKILRASNIRISIGGREFPFLQDHPPLGASVRFELR